MEILLTVEARISLTDTTQPLATKTLLSETKTTFQTISILSSLANFVDRKENKTTVGTTAGTTAKETVLATVKGNAIETAIEDSTETATVRFCGAF